MPILKRTRLAISLSDEALRLLDQECEKRAWARPTLIDYCLIKVLRKEQYKHQDAK